MTIAVDSAGTELERHMIRVSPVAQLTSSLHQCENGVAMKYMCTGPAEYIIQPESKEEQSAGDQEEMEAHLRFLNMDLEMEVLDLESCLTFGEEFHAQDAEVAFQDRFQDREAGSPRLSLRAELAKARRGKVAENMKRSSSESAFQETATFTPPSKAAVAEPSPGGTPSEAPEYVLSSADRMQMDSLLLPEPFEPSEEEMLIRDRDLSPFQSAPDVGRFNQDEKREVSLPEAEHVSRQKRKVSPSEADRDSGKRLRCESVPWKESECNSKVLLETPESGCKKDKEDEPEARKDKEKPGYSATDKKEKPDHEVPSSRRLRNGESETPSTTKMVAQPYERTQKSRQKTKGKTKGHETNEARQSSTMVNDDIERDPNGSAACGDGAKKARVTDADTGPKKVLKIKQVGILRVKRKPETCSDQSGRDIVNVQDTRGEYSNKETAATLKELSEETVQPPEVIDFDDGPSPDRKRESSGVVRKPETRSDRKKKMREAPGRLQTSGSVDAERATAKRRCNLIGRRRTKTSVSQAETLSGEIESTDRATEPVKTESPRLRRSEAEKSMQADTQVLVIPPAVKPPVRKGSKIQRKRGVYVGL